MPEKMISNFKKTYSFVSFFKNVDLSQNFIKIIAKNAKNSRFFKKPLLKGTLLNHHVLIDFRAPKTAALIVDMSEVKFSKILGIIAIFRVSILKYSDLFVFKKTNWNLKNRQNFKYFWKSGLTYVYYESRCFGGTKTWWFKEFSTSLSKTIIFYEKVTL